MLATLFLQPPSFDGFDGGAGSRYQARREIRSFWYPTWLAQLAALVPGSKLVDAPPAGLTLGDVLPLAKEHELVVMHTSTPSFASDVRVAQALKAENPKLKIGMVGARVSVDRAGSLARAPAVDFVAGNEYDFTIREVAEGRPLDRIVGLSYRDASGGIVNNPDRGLIEDLDVLPFVTPVYARDLRMEDYFQGYLLHPYVSFYTGRGCRSHCTYCLWPQTVSGRRYRTRSVANVAQELAYVKQAFPKMKELFFDDDTFTDDRPHAEAIARELSKLGMTWSCTAKANVPRSTLEVLRDNGLRLLLVGYESGNQGVLNNMKKGVRTDVMRRFTQDCHDLGITVHGCFIVGLPGETRETIEETIRFACELDPHTIQVSVPAPYPGTELYRDAVANGWLDAADAELVDGHGVQLTRLSYPHLSHEEIHAALETFYRRFYFRGGKIAEIVGEMIRSPHMMKRRLREGVEFFQFLRARRTESAPPAASP